MKKDPSQENDMPKDESRVVDTTPYIYKDTARAKKKLNPPDGYKFVHGVLVADKDK